MWPASAARVTAIARSVVSPWSWPGHKADNGQPWPLGSRPWPLKSRQSVLGLPYLGLGLDPLAVKSSFI
jgi:hypothetical protein